VAGAGDDDRAREGEDARRDLEAHTQHGQRVRAAGAQRREVEAAGEAPFPAGEDYSQRVVRTRAFERGVYRLQHLEGEGVDAPVIHRHHCDRILELAGKWLTHGSRGDAALGRLLWRDERFERTDEARQVLLRSRPHDCQVYIAVSVNDPVAHARDLRPVNLRMPRSECRRHVGRRLADYLDLVRDERVEQPVTEERILRDVLKFRNRLTGGQKHVEKEGFVTNGHRAVALY
jgi:hypothetical protein